MQHISVGPEFEWVCPICRSHCIDDIPVVVDKFIMGVLASNGPNSKKEFFQIKMDGEICDDSASESESDSDEE